MGFLVLGHCSEELWTYSYNTENDRNSVVSQASCRMVWTLLELQAEIGIEKRTIYKILREDYHLRKIALKWVPHALTEVEKWTQYAICHLNFCLFQNSHYFYIQGHLGLPKDLFPVCFSVKILKALLSSSIMATCPVNHNLLDDKKNTAWVCCVLSPDQQWAWPWLQLLECGVYSFGKSVAITRNKCKFQ